LIEVDGLTRYYGDHAAVRDVSFRAEHGEIVGFLGPNGAGKTTTMRMLTCFLPPSAGTARVAGHDILEAPFDVRKNIGYLPESVPLYRDLTVSSYLDFVATLKGMSRLDRKRRIAGVMDQCGISDVQNKRIDMLSRGYRQRVGLAQALVNDPAVLILDEPTVGLDPRQIVEIRELIRGLAGERTVILSTHILAEVSLLCQRVLIINRGRLIGDDTLDNLGAGLKGEARIEVSIRGDAERATQLVRTVPGVNSVEQASAVNGVSRLQVKTNGSDEVQAAVARAIVEAGFGLISLSSRQMSLEDIFVRLVTGEHGNHE